MKNIDKIFEQIAKKEGIEVMEIEREIDYLIKVSMKNSGSDSDTEAGLDGLLVNGRTPTAKELIALLADMLKDEKNYF